MAVWADHAENAVRELVALGKNFGPTHEQFTSDDVWELLAMDEIPSPPEPRALGPVMQRMIREKLITPVGYAESRRRHGGIVRTYVAL